MTAKVNILFFMVLLFDWSQGTLIEMVRLARVNIVVAFLFIIPVSFAERKGRTSHLSDRGLRQSIRSSDLLVERAWISR
jgi:hypothetical protein